MNKAGVYHRATDSLCYPLDGETLHIRLQTAAGDVTAVSVSIGDPHDWEKSSGEDGKGAWSWRSTLLDMNRSGGDGIRDFWELRYRPPYRRARYVFHIEAADGSAWDYGERGLGPADPESGGVRRAARDPWNFFVYPYIQPTDVYSIPSWVPMTVWYQIFPERFRNGDTRNDPPGTLPWGSGSVTNREFYGGDLAGILEKLDHLAALGINGIYLTPIFVSRSVHKYDTEEYGRIDPAFGDEEDLRRLVEGCHARGIRIMLDAVFNHSGRTFAPWRDVVEKGEDSPYAGWFRVRSWPLFPKGRDTGNSRESGFDTFSFTTSMPKLNTANPETREYLIGIAERFVRDFGIDGWRLDVASEVDREFWRVLRTRIKSIAPEAFILGEVWHDSMPWLRGDQFDAVMDYSRGLAIEDFLLARHGMDGAEELEARLRAIDFSYPEPVVGNSFLLLDSHDTDRLVHRLGGDLARLAWLLLFMLPGSPCVYYGSEYGLSGGPDPDNRRCMIWDKARQDQEQYGFFRGLVAMRRARYATFSKPPVAREFRLFPDRPGFAAISVGRDAERVVALVNREARPLEAEAVHEALRAFGLGSPSILLRDPRESGEGAAAAALLGRGFRLLCETGLAGL